MPTPAEIAALRTLALVGPATAGKTSLVEALLWKAGASARPAAWSVAPPSATTTRWRDRRSARSTPRWCISTTAASRPT